MSGLWVAVLAPLPFHAFVFWAIGWLVVDALRERRIARAAANISARKSSPPTNGGRPAQNRKEPNQWTNQPSHLNRPMHDRTTRT